MNGHDIQRLAGVVAPRTSHGGRSRAATPSACGAGTLWRRHAHPRPGDFVPRLVCDCGSPPPRRHLGPIRPWGEGPRMRGGYTPSSHFSPFIQKNSQKPPKYHFLHFNFNPNSEVGNEIEKTRREPSAVGRVTPCAPRLPPARAKFPRRRLPDPLPIKTLLEFPVPTSEFGLNPEPLRLKSETFNLKPS